MMPGPVELAIIAVIARIVVCGVQAWSEGAAGGIQGRGGGDPSGATGMIVDDECSSVPFSKLRAGDVWRCPQTQDWFMKLGVGRGAQWNCVRLSDGLAMNRAEDWDVDFFPGARFVVP